MKFIPGLPKTTTSVPELWLFSSCSYSVESQPQADAWLCLFLGPRSLLLDTVVFLEKAKSFPILVFIACSLINTHLAFLDAFYTFSI